MEVALLYRCARNISPVSREAQAAHCADASWTGAGMAELAELIESRLPRPERTDGVLLPYTRGDLVARIHADGEVLSEEHTGDGTLISARVRSDLAAALQRFAAPVPAGER